MDQQQLLSLFSAAASNPEQCRLLTARVLKLRRRIDGWRNALAAGRCTTTEHNTAVARYRAILLAEIREVFPGATLTQVDTPQGKRWQVRRAKLTAFSNRADGDGIDL